MPIYEYRCTNGHTFELLQRITDPAPDRCEICEAGVERVLYPVAVHFKGSGFYSTDYGKGSKRRDGAKEGKDADGGGEPKKADGGEKAAAASSSPD
jgi:putative FmdB family regulatory protein